MSTFQKLMIVLHNFPLGPLKTIFSFIQLVNEQGESEPLEADHSIVAKNPFDLSDPPSDLQIVDYDNKVWF